MLKTLFAGSLIFFAAQNVLADVIEQVVSVPVGISQDTNPTLSATNKRSVMITTATPRYKVTSTNPLQELSADLAMQIERSSDQSVRINRDDPSLALGWKKELPKGLLNLGAKYDQTSTRVSELTETGLVQQDGSRRNQSLGASYTHLLSDRLNLSVNGNYTRVKYSGGTLDNYTLPAAAFALNYQYSETLVSYIQTSFSQYQPEGRGQNSEYTTLVGGAQWDWSDRLNLNFNLGVNQIKAAQNDMGLETALKLKYLLLRGNVSAGFSRASTASGNGGFIEADQLQASINYDLSDRSGVGSDISLRQNKGPNKSEYYQLGVFYRYEITPQWNLRLNAQYKENKNTSNQSASGNVVGITINYITPTF